MPIIETLVKSNNKCAPQTLKHNMNEFKKLYIKNSERLSKLDRILG